MNKRYYLNLCGFNLEIIQENPKEFDKFADVLVKYIKTQFNWAIKKKSNNIDYKIRFIPGGGIKTYPRKKGYYIELFKKISENSVTASSNISLYQFHMILKLILDKLLVKKGGFFIHCSAIKHNNKAYLFLGNEGAGKSTIKNFLKDKFSVLCDDSGVISSNTGRYIFFQSPLIEKDNIIKTTEHYEVGGFFFLIKGKKCKITKISNYELILKKLLNQNLKFNTFSKKNFIKIILDLLKKQNKFYSLSFPNNKKSTQLFIDRLITNVNN